MGKCNSRGSNGNAYRSLQNAGALFRFENARCFCFFFQKNPRVRNFSACNSGAGNGCANLWAPGIFWFFLLENPMSIKFRVLRGGGCWGFLEGGVEVPILFLWARFFSDSLFLFFIFWGEFPCSSTDLYTCKFGRNGPKRVLAFRAVFFAIASYGQPASIT